MSSQYFARKSSLVALLLSLLHTATCQTGYQYVLDTEYAGEDFFDGWNFFTVRQL